MSPADDIQDQDGIKNEVVVTSDDGSRITVCQIPQRGRIDLFILDADNPPWCYPMGSVPPTANPWVRAVDALQIEEPDYHWDTPRYRELCIEGGLDPDYGRPHFRPEDATVAEQLVRIVNLTRHPLVPVAASIVMDIIELLRLDRSTPDDVHGIKNQFASLIKRNPEAAEQLLSMINHIKGKEHVSTLLL